jgi:hypothetical protein
MYNFSIQLFEYHTVIILVANHSQLEQKQNKRTNREYYHVSSGWTDVPTSKVS